jgi:hypothetical protein
VCPKPGGNTSGETTPSSTHPLHHDAIVPSRDKAGSVSVEEEVVDMERELGLVERFAGSRVDEEGEAAVVAAAGDEPLAPRVEGEALDEALEFGRFELAEGPALFRIEKPESGEKASDLTPPMEWRRCFGSHVYMQEASSEAISRRVATSHTRMRPVLSAVARRLPSGLKAQVNNIEGYWCGVSAA